MRIYHGSTVIVQKPESRKSEMFLDFGDGFYTTTSYEQAERWAMIKAKRQNLDAGFVSVFDFDDQAAFVNLDVKRFAFADEEWLMYIVNSRKGITPKKATDMVIGPVADDNIYQSIRLSEAGAYNVEETIKRFKSETLRDQWVFQSTQSLVHLKYIDADKIETKGGSCMGQEQFAVMMPFISADLVAMISVKDDVSPEAAMATLYSSQLYELLETEETKVWHYSTDMQYLLYEQEQRTGTIVFPDV